MIYYKRLYNIDNVDMYELEFDTKYHSNNTFIVKIYIFAKSYDGAVLHGIAHEVRINTMVITNHDAVIEDVLGVISQKEITNLNLADRSIIYNEAVKIGEVGMKLVGVKRMYAALVANNIDKLTVADIGSVRYDSYLQKPTRLKLDSHKAI